MDSREVSSPPSCRSVGEEEVGGGLWLLWAASSLPRVRVVGSSCSQESLVLADPSLVASFVSAGRDCWSRSHEFGESTGDRSRPSRSSPSRGRHSCDGRRCARSRSRGSRDRSRDSRSRSMDRSRSRGCRRSRCDSSRFPSACVRSRWSRSLDGVTVRSLDD